MVALTLKEPSLQQNNLANNEKLTQMADDHAEEPNFSDPEDFVDDIQDSELLEDVIKAKPNEQESIDAVVVVDGLPKVGQEKSGKLKTVLNNVFKKVGNVLSEYYPEGPNPDSDNAIMTKGYCFVEFESKVVAQDAVNLLNGYKLDKTHTFVVTLFKDFEKYKAMDDLENWEPPKHRPYKDRGNLRSWLLNTDSFDQFVLQSESGDKVAVYWNSVGQPTVLSEKLHWSDTFIRWSPYGTYLATVHKQGIALWGGEKFEQIVRFTHVGAQYFDFSPCEKFIVTYAPPKSKYTDVTDAVKVWTVRTGELKRSFSAAGDAVKKWPHFKWSCDDKYFATLAKDDSIYIYETATFTLLDKKPVKLESVRDFQWSPNQPIFAYWVAEKGNNPGRVAIMNVPEKVTLRSKNMFQLADASIHWQKSGDNLCFKVDRYSKKKEGEDGEIKYSHISIQLEIFHVRVKEVPVTMLEIKEAVQAFGWEPVGTKFCIIQGDMRSVVAVYQVKTLNPIGVTHLKTLEHKGQVNSIFWSPHGQFVVCAGLKTASSGTLIFVDCSQSDSSIMNVQEHTGVTDVEWDPTGRFVMTGVSTWSSSTTRGLDFGYMMWNFQGRLLARRPVEFFCSFFWRPRPASLLIDTKLKEIKKNIKKYAAEFEEKDKKKLDKASQEVLEKRRSQMADYKKWREAHAQKFLADKQDQLKLRGSVEEPNVSVGDVDEETIEFLINQEETIVE